MAHAYHILATLLVAVGCVYAQVKLSIEPSYAKLYVFAPSGMNISCKGEGYDDTKVVWYKDGVLLANSGFQVSNKLDILGTKQTEVVTLQKGTTNFSDAGKYTCRRGPGKEQPIEVVVVKSEVVQSEFDRAMKTATLVCNFVENPARESNASYQMHWEYKGKKLEDDNKFDIHKENGTLIIHDPVRSDSGEYVCVYTFDKQVTRIPVNFNASPYVFKFDKSKNLIQGDPLTLRCNVASHPPADIFWFKDGVLLENSDKIQIKTDDKTNQKDGMLRIQSVEFEDKGEYMCTANNSMYNKTANSTIIVRVKDKLAALWPFLGIVAEVIVLCVIIFIYEKKRSKSDDDDDAADTGNSANAADHKPGEVRQRNVRT